MEHILVEAVGRRTRRDGHQDMIPTDHIRSHTRLLYVVLHFRQNMMPQPVVRLVLVLGEGVHQRRVVFRPQVFRTEGCITAEENLRVQVRRTRATETYTHAL